MKKILHFRRFSKNAVMIGGDGIKACPGFLRIHFCLGKGWNSTHRFLSHNLNKAGIEGKVEAGGLIRIGPREHDSFGFFTSEKPGIEVDDHRYSFRDLRKWFSHRDHPPDWLDRKLFSCQSSHLRRIWAGRVY